MNMRAHLIWFASLAVAYLGLRSLLFYRLKRSHAAVWEEMGKPRVFVPFDPVASRRAHEYFKTESIRTSDTPSQLIAISLRLVLAIAYVKIALYLYSLYQAT